jgi:hypothetical protein
MSAASEIFKGNLFIIYLLIYLFIIKDKQIYELSFGLLIR